MNFLARQKLSATGDLHLRLRSRRLSAAVIHIVFGGADFSVMPQFA